MRKTKIVCTIGPTSGNEEVIRQLMLAGMDVARLNFSHGTHEQQKGYADIIKKVRGELKLPVALMLDTKGPEIRTGHFEKPVTLKKGNDFTLTTRNVTGSESICSVSFGKLPQEVIPGAAILVDDGLIGLKVKSSSDTEIYCTVMNGGEVSSQKSINVPGLHLSLPFISEKDRADIAFAAEQDFDFIAASFTRSAQDIIDLRSELEKHNSHKIRIIAKIENSDGVKNIDEIIRVSDGVMIARGDLGVEVPLEEIPSIQKQFIRKTSEAGGQVITATQMLDSMIKNPRPTRAEVTDVANAIYDGTSAIMLSGETANGAYPVLAVKTMARIAERAERDIDYIKRFRLRSVGSGTSNERPNVTEAISHATCTTAHDLGAAAIITVTKSGRTARMISKYRPNCPIISGTTDPTVLHQMSLSWGVIPIMIDEQSNTDNLFDHVVDKAKEHGLVQDGDLVVITGGAPVGMSGTTNLLKVQLVGNILLSGMSATKGAACGNVCICNSKEDVKKNLREGDILVISETTNELMPYLRQAGAIVTEREGKNSHAAIIGMALDKPVIVGAQNATKILKNGTTVTVDATRGIVYSGKEKIAVEG